MTARWIAVFGRKPQEPITFAISFGGLKVLTRHFLEATAVCTRIMRRYHARERTAASRTLMVAEVETLAGWLQELGLPAGAYGAVFLPPVKDYLFTRYGTEAGERLFAELVAVLEGTGMFVVRDRLLLQTH